jgi:hypothetical protein
LNILRLSWFGDTMIEHTDSLKNEELKKKEAMTKAAGKE